MQTYKIGRVNEVRRLARVPHVEKNVTVTYIDCHMNTLTYPTDDSTVILPRPDSSESGILTTVLQRQTIM